MSRPPAPANALPGDLEHYRSTPLFTESSVPDGLRAEHATKTGVWGLIRLISGNLRYSVTDPRRSATSVVLTAGSAPGIVEPTILHSVEPLGPVEFQVDFYRGIAVGRS